MLTEGAPRWASGKQKRAEPLLFRPLTVWSDHAGTAERPAQPIGSAQPVSSPAGPAPTLRAPVAPLVGA